MKEDAIEENKEAGIHDEKDLCEISVTRIDSRKFLKVGESEIEIKDFEINSSGDGDTKLTVVIDKGASVFSIAF